MPKFVAGNMLMKYLKAQPRDMYNIVGALIGYINADPAFRTDDFDQAIQYVLEQGVGKKELFAPFNLDLPFKEDRSKWDKEYYCFALVYLNDNFCEKRIAHVKAIARKLYPSEAPIAQEEGPQTARKKNRSQQTHPAVNKMTIALIVILLLALVIGMIMAKR